MKHITSTVTVGLLAIALLGLILHGQQGASQSPPAPQAQSFNAHYSELELTIGPAVYDEEGAHYAYQSFQLPVANRPVRMSATFTAADGEISVGEVVACHKSSTGECGFQFFGGDSSVGRQVNFQMFAAPTGESTPRGISLIGETDGTFQIQNAYIAGGTVRLAFWY